MPLRHRSVIAAVSAAGLVAALLGVPVAATASSRVDGPPVTTSDSKVADSVVSCSAEGFTGTAWVRATSDPAEATVTFTVTSVKIDPAKDSSGRSEANLDIFRSDASLVPGGADDVWTSPRSLSSTLMQDGQQHAVDLSSTSKAGSPRNYLARYVFTFDSPIADVHCTTPAASLVVHPSHPSPDASCSLRYWQGDQACWRTEEDSIVTVDVTSANLHMPEYFVLNPDYSIDHRGRFTNGTSSRIFLLEGQTLALTSPINVSSPNTIQVRSVRPMAEGLQPEVGEQCVASNQATTACFVVAPRNYRVQIAVIHTPFGTAPEYFVTHATTGQRKHGGRLEMSGVSTIWIDAGDQFWLTSPSVNGDRNAISITDVRAY